MAMAPPQKTAGLAHVLQGIFEVCMIIIDFAMRIAPLGVACLGFALTAQLGFEVVRSLGFYALVVVLGLALHMFVTYSLLLKLWARTSPIAFFRNIQDVVEQRDAARVTARGGAELEAAAADQPVRADCRCQRQSERHCAL
jgi:DAACS family dicarboxylate/amino acid:cation (Na+ or H+) symporter